MGKKRKKNNNYNQNNRNYNQKKEISSPKKDISLKQNFASNDVEIQKNLQQKNPNKNLDEQFKNSEKSAIELSKNTTLDNKLILEENKKNDIEKIFDVNKNKTIAKKTNGSIGLIIFLILVIICLIAILLINMNNPKQGDCQIDECPIENNNPKDDDKNNNSKEETYLFLGDSIFYQYNTGDYFRDYNTINTGVNGITALKTLERLEESVYQYNPTTIFILLGTNDLYYDYTPEETFEHLKQLIDKIHLDKPEITINVLSILPINKSDNPKVSKEANGNKTNEQINQVNDNLYKYCEDNKLNYINVHDLLLDSNNELNLAYSYEGLHITELGYHHITMELLKYMHK
ncbi:MAG: hypothetical protein HFI86_03925 [Bacilli bacterium]|nr:hypothetical protein [Bacilli bacterium]